MENMDVCMLLFYPVVDVSKRLNRMGTVRKGNESD